MDKLTKIEERLLELEMGKIKAQLVKVGEDIIEIFKPYMPLKGDHSKALGEFIQKSVLGARASYFSGYQTSPAINLHRNSIPDELKEVVLERAVREFFNKIEEIESVTQELSL